MWDVIQEKQMIFTPRLADKYLIFNTHPNQRILTVPKLNRYTNKMRNGLWLSTANVSLAHINGDTFMANGQHFLHAIIQACMPQKGNLIEVKTDNEGFSKFYRQFDSRDQSRTMENYVRIEINALNTNWKPRSAALCARV